MKDSDTFEFLPAKTDSSSYDHDKWSDVLSTDWGVTAYEHTLSNIHVTSFETSGGEAAVGLLLPAVQVVVPSSPDQQDSFDGDAVNTPAAAYSGGGGGGKISDENLSMIKYIDSANATGDLSGTVVGEGLETALLLPAVQQAREAALPVPEAAGGEPHTIETMDTWGDFFLG